MGLSDWRRPARRYQQRRKTQGGVAAAHPGYLRQRADRSLPGAEGRERPSDPVSSVGTSLAKVNPGRLPLVQQPTRRSMVDAGKRIALLCLGLVVSLPGSLRAQTAPPPGNADLQKVMDQ